MVLGGWDVMANKASVFLFVDCIGSDRVGLIGGPDRMSD